MLIKAWGTCENIKCKAHTCPTMESSIICRTSKNCLNTRTSATYKLPNKLICL